MKTVQTSMTIGADTKYLSHVRGFVSSVARQGALGRRDENRVMLAVDEAVTNIITHAYEHAADANIRIDVALTPQAFKVTLTDTGRYFNPEGMSPANIKEHIRRGRRRGLGIFLIRQVMDEVRYRYVAGTHNELHLVRYLGRDNLAG